MTKGTKKTKKTEPAIINIQVGEDTISLLGSCLSLVKEVAEDEKVGMDQLLQLIKDCGPGFAKQLEDHINILALINEFLDQGMYDDYVASVKGLFGCNQQTPDVLIAAYDALMKLNEMSKAATHIPDKETVH